jgi:MFS family permease
VDGVVTPFQGSAPNPNVAALIGLVFIQVIFVCAVYGPIAAYLVEAFPAKVRYTSMSLPYHIGNGVFGGLLPLIGLSICAWTGNMYAGLAYPIIVALLTAAIGSRALPETHKVRIWDEFDASVAEGDAAAVVDVDEAERAAAVAPPSDGSADALADASTTEPLP